MNTNQRKIDKKYLYIGMSICILVLVGLKQFWWNPLRLREAADAEKIHAAYKEYGFFTDIVTVLYNGVHDKYAMIHLIPGGKLNKFGFARYDVLYDFDGDGLCKRLVEWKRPFKVRILRYTGGESYELIEVEVIK